MNDSIYIWIEILWYTLLAVLAVGIPAKLLVNWIRFPCQFCNEKIELFKRIDFYEQRDILDYFRQYENREPDQGGLFVCTKMSIPTGAELSAKYAACCSLVASPIGKWCATIVRRPINGASTGAMDIDSSRPPVEPDSWPKHRIG